MAGSQNYSHDHARLTAGVNLSAKQFRFVRASGSLAVLCQARQRILGVLLNTPTSNQVAIIDIDAGAQKVVGGGSINFGALVGSDSTGRAVELTPIEGAIASGNTGAFAGGFALENATTAGHLLAISFSPIYVVL